ncbi:MAG: 16S rRNA (cytosine(1402)-N(4))-methyltransferase RsmH [Coriobacteriia bacterium]|nr:16S rRNA (cytosine(1402)-N(4))-methyltransferase RsmH [Coriobacteriia bacterium]MCL2606517.1 16S rRNA (cytosine(1402)-N(4))-methyltransferase RsmH [Coriobacteriia bacterium]
MTTEYMHTPVLLAETLDCLNPASGNIACDATLGRAGHGSLLAQKTMQGGGTYIGIDLDADAITAARPMLEGIRTDVGAGEFFLIQGSFANLDSILASIDIAYVDTFLFDLGVSSPQIDDLQRGFSFKHDAPLDMRLDQGADIPTAADMVNTLEKQELSRILRDYGEEKWASRIASFIVRQRESTPISTSSQLVDIIKAAIPASARRAGGHPAKRSFQALRIAVNGELDALQRGLESAIRWAASGGRIGVLTFHSLEDRIVKRSFAEAEKICNCPSDLPLCMCVKKATLEVLTKRPIVPSEEEISANPRARSTKLRVAQKI